MRVAWRESGEAAGGDFSQGDEIGSKDLWRAKTIAKKGEAFLLTVRASLLTVKPLCLQPLKALVRRTFPL